MPAIAVTASIIIVIVFIIFVVIAFAKRNERELNEPCEHSHWNGNKCRACGKHYNEL